MSSMNPYSDTTRQKGRSFYRKGAMKVLLLCLVAIWLQRLCTKLLGGRRSCPSSVPLDVPPFVDRLPYSKPIITSVCHGCFQASHPNGTSCGELIGNLIYSERVKTWEPFLLAGKRVCKEECMACLTSEKHYWKHDDAAPFEVASVSHFLESIPSSHRLPRKAVDDLTTFFKENPGQSYPKRTFLFEYNPSVVVIPESQRPSPDAIYLASYRVTAFQYCFKHPKAKNVFNIQDSYPEDAPPLAGLVALVVMGVDLQPIDEVVIDGRKVFPKFEDPRLFVIHDQLYMASFEYIVPFWLRPTQSSIRLSHYWPGKGNKLAVFMRRKPSCCASESCEGGKNFNYFEDAHGTTLLESNPVSPRIVETIDLNKECSQNQKHRVFRDDRNHNSSFQTFDALVLAKARFYQKLEYSEERGTACCVDVTHQGRRYKVGISHSKSKRVEEVIDVVTGRQYFSRLYAFEPKAPYRVAAVSGSFCLGFPNAQDEDANYFHLAARQQYFRMGEDLECPKIAFASGITDLGDDRALISYGINDCSSRIILVRKSDLVSMLFQPEDRIG